MQLKKLTTEEVAEQLQVSEVTVRRWIQQGKMRAAKLGKSWRIDQEDVNRFFEDHIQSSEG